MAISAVVAAVSVGVAGYQINSAKHAGIDASNAALEQAKKDQAAQIAAANADLSQTMRMTATQAEAEKQRASADDGALAGQQSTLTPTVQLASQGSGDASASKARTRRAQFRPEYSSGVTI